MNEQTLLALRAALYALNTIPRKRINYDGNLKTTYDIAALIDKVLTEAQQ
jgi:hypothetical protein